MLRFTFPRSVALPLVLGVAAGLAACGESPMGASDGAATAPADAPASAPPGPDFSGDFDLVGTEPFWGGAIRPDGLSLTRAGEAEVRADNPGVRVKGGAGVWDAGALVLKLRAEPCSDGMSDRRYGYRAEVTLEGRTLRGCAAAPGTAPPQ
ncbi:hypothetical protein [Caulobacter sp. BK020]|uniref:COG3650 family protein n=1 Tax=Caulobacter sp. BK020 TaxID=2512117 RepID=UPI001050E8FF|nr:hypothetical protein [Caulobacter sp. BK020]TCS12447.1 putative membrane protein [Caulobacter sp. BK020]